MNYKESVDNVNEPCGCILRPVLSLTAANKTISNVFLRQQLRKAVHGVYTNSNHYSSEHESVTRLIHRTHFTPDWRIRHKNNQTLLDDEILVQFDH